MGSGTALPAGHPEQWAHTGGNVLKAGVSGGQPAGTCVLVFVDKSEKVERLPEPR